ncbi:MAG: MtrB/PioB family decaheme-associated outer membrane protein [Acidobacteria bacterium]|nr:MtrB/PioB family decaheme-associated outer membrane protein [Acidobacteriota bacterium]
MKALNRLISHVIVAQVALLSGPALQAQEEKPARGLVEIGVRQLAGDHGSSKFNEYHHIPAGFYLQQFEVYFNKLPGKFFLNAQTRETLEKDQSYRFGLGQEGKYRFEFRWDRTPHVFANGARVFFGGSGGVYTIPGPTRSLLQSTPANLPSLVDGAQLQGVSLARNAGTGTFTYTPTANWAVQLQYSNEQQAGVRPIGTTTNAFTNSIELPEPVDYRTNQAKASVEYGNDKGGFQSSYSGSLFRNRVGELVWDNPFRTADAAGGASRGRIDLYPDNAAHALSFAGAYNLAESTRLMASISPGWMLQNDAFLPFTINTALAGVPALPAASLNGKKQRLSMNYTATSNPLPALTLTARYRSYDYNNNTPSLVFSNYVRADADMPGPARRSLPYAYNRQNLGLEASWQFLNKHALKAGYDMERFDREHRDTTRSNEHTGGVTLDINPKKWLLVRTSYKHARREPRHYEANEESFPLGEGALSLGELPGLRKFDQAARSRDRAEALLQMDSDKWSLSGSYFTTQDRYTQSLYGLLNDVSYNYTVDVSYQLRHDVTLFADYTRERYRYNQRSRQRVPPTATAPANDSPNNDWESFTRDVVHTGEVGINASALRKKVTIDTFYSLTVAKGSIATRAMGSSSIAGFLVTTAQDYPNTGNRFHQVTTTCRYQLPRSAALKLDYRFERYDRVDFQIDRMRPYMVPLDPSTNTSIYLGLDFPRYNVHIISVALEYRF